MGKSSNFERNPRDFYPTPYEAVPPLLAHLWRGMTFIEPCAGDGRLVRHLAKNGFRCNYACDIAPQPSGPVTIAERDVLFFDGPFPAADCIITNPPWDREILHRMIEIFRVQMPTWLLFDSDWMFTAQAKPYLEFCDKIVAIGRISWMGNGVSSLDNCCWYRFIDKPTKIEFIP